MPALPRLMLAFLCLLTAGCYKPAGQRNKTGVPAYETKPVPLIQALRVVAYAGPEYQQIPQFRRRVGDRIDSASDILSHRFGLRLDLARVEFWDVPKDIGLSATLQELRTHQAAPDADLVIGFVGRPFKRQGKPIVVAGDYARRHMVVRSLSRFYERQEAQQHTAEVRSILAGISRIFGALPSCNGHIMEAPMSYSPRNPFTWHPLNARLIRLHGTLDLRAVHGKGITIPNDIRARVTKRLTGIDSTATCPSGLAALSRLKFLSSLTKKARKKRRVLKTKPSPANCTALAEQSPTQGAALCAGRIAEGQRDFKKAVRFYRAHLDGRPEDVSTMKRLARILGRTGDDSAALALLNRALEIRPKDQSAMLNLGIAFARQGRYHDARKIWLQLLSLNPNHKDAQSLLGRLPR